MSWKSLVTAGLFCVLASPAFANPTVSATGGGTTASGFLDNNGNWVWKITVAPTNPIPTGSSPLAAELGFTETSSRNIIGNATVGDAVTWDKLNPGNPIFNWETPDPTANNKPVGVQTHNVTDQVFSALGSAVLSATTPTDYLHITVQRPQTASAGTLSTTTMSLSGAYGGKGRIAEATATGAANYDVYTGSVSFNAKAGDTNLDGQVSNADYSALIGHYQQNAGTNKWSDGDFTGEGDVSNADYSMLISNYNSGTYNVVSGSFANAGAGAGLSAGGSVPEPASIALLGLALVGGMGMIRRKR